MKLEQLSALAELVSSVAIVVTLIYLTVEVKQNTDALNAQSRQSVLASAQTELFMMVEHPDLVTSVIEPGPLSRADSIRLDTYLTATLRAREFSWLQHQSGLIDDDQWNTEVAVIVTVLSSERIRLWWKKLGHTYVSEEFAGFVDGIIRDMPISEDSWEAQATWSEP